MFVCTVLLHCYSEYDNILNLIWDANSEFYLDIQVKVIWLGWGGYTTINLTLWGFFRFIYMPFENWSNLHLLLQVVTYTSSKNKGLLVKTDESRKIHMWLEGEKHRYENINRFMDMSKYQKADLFQKVFEGTKGGGWAHKAGSPVENIK